MKKVQDTLKQMMGRDADTVAAIIVNDIGLKPGAVSLSDCLERCEKYGGSVYFTDEIPAKYAGWCFPEWLVGESFIVIRDSDISDDEKANIVIHELAHRLLYSQAYEPLSYEVPTVWPRREFHEAIARAVEKRFIQAGGIDYRRGIS